ncbi:hypothetical protein OVA24_10695 [Luteolibacter sp. SL250]|uniref:hypothetical protein n=1 Tax=Luteolibacter sp. SL250 TaxID=2995170 RepID=UPI00226E6483|nr:hypothetical protein [Luteolibacter sp. SL250]WAC21851.1 hypothetical protein OVA24_10695 [Luteolibacter sp. SL250]
MKSLLSRNWFRRLCQSLLGLVSLIALLYAAANWHGAGMRRDAVRKMKAEDQPTRLSDMVRALPPEDENFAMIPLLAEARSESFDPGKQDANYAPGSARARLNDAQLRRGGSKNRFFRHDDGSLNDLKKSLKLTGDAATNLATFEKTLAGVLPDLRAGLDRPQTASPTLAMLCELDDSNVSYGLSFQLVDVVGSLTLRAELALEAGRSDIAHESMMICLRLMETMASDQLMTSLILRGAAFSRTQPTLAKCLERCGWSDTQLNAIRSRLARWNPTAEFLRALELEITASFPMFDSYKEGQPSGYISSPGSWNAFSIFPRVVPGGLWDRSAAMVVSRELDLRKELAKTENLKGWLDVCNRYAATSPKPEFFNHTAVEWDFARQCRMAVDLTIQIHQAVLACDLELHRLEHGSYPSSLAALPGTSKIDPLTGEPFRHRMEGSRLAIHSVGTDLKDDGGQPWRKGKPPTDVVW